MARGLSEEEATSTIVRGFLNVAIEGLPASLQKDLDVLLAKSDEGRMWLRRIFAANFAYAKKLRNGFMVFI